MAASVLCTLLLMLTTLTWEGWGQDACSPQADSSQGFCTDIGLPQSEIQSATTENGGGGQDVAGSCGFSRGQCGYTQGCQQGGAPDWVWRNDTGGTGYMEFKATRNGFHGKMSVLETPKLELGQPSCLGVHATIFNPVTLDIVLLAASDNKCTEMIRGSDATMTSTFTLHLPAGVTKILFRGHGGGDTRGFARIYSISLVPGCCQDPEFPSSDGVRPDAGSQCQWDLDHTQASQSGIVLSIDAPVGTATSPWIRPASADLLDCLRFEFLFLPTSEVGQAKSITVSLLDLHGGASAVWKVPSYNDSSWGTIVYKTGQFPISTSGNAFKIRFTLRKDTSKNASSLVAVDNIKYYRGRAQECPYIPSEAEVLRDSDTSDLTVVVVGVVVGAVIVLLAILCAVFYHRRRKERKAESGNTQRPDMDNKDPTGNDQQAAKNEYTTAVVKPRAHSLPNDDEYSLAEIVTSPDDATKTSDTNGAVGKPTNDLPSEYSLADGSAQSPDPKPNAGLSAGPKTIEARSLPAIPKSQANEYSRAKVTDECGSGADCLEPANDYHEIDCGPQREGNAALASDEYDMLATGKGDNRAESRQVATQAYDHVGVFDDKQYDVLSRDKKNVIISSDYNRLK